MRKRAAWPGLFRARPQPSSTSKLLNQPTFPIPPFVRAIRSDKKLAPLPGKSLTPLLAGKTEWVRTEEDWIGEELFGNRMVRQGDWKLAGINRMKGQRGNSPIR